ncbi:thioesterase II family protein [Amycolatopsis sp. cmx-11-12]|uniref:thioesterase II family protein n=1 Tax=Amycolatopsis sp. cmx-11-12 TaxID=2785795 RepID=UPI0039175C53
MTGGWLVSWPEFWRQDVRVTLLCVPPAGAGANQFRSWQEALGPQVGVVAVQLPGREGRWRHPKAESMEEVYDAVVPDVWRLAAQRPLVIFGHCFGAIIGYEVARRLEHDSSPEAVVVSACRSPDLWVGGELFGGDDELVGLLAARGLDVDDVDEDSQEMLLRTLRADIELCTSYRHEAGVTLSSPLHVWGGSDDSIVPRAQMDGWNRFTSGHSRQRDFSGGHYFINDDQVTALTELRRVLDAATGAAAGGQEQSWTQPEHRDVSC